LCIFRALLNVYRALLCVFRALLNAYRALLCVFRALLEILFSVDRSILGKILLRVLLSVNTTI